MALAPGNNFSHLLSGVLFNFSVKSLTLLSYKRTLEMLIVEEEGLKAYRHEKSIFSLIFRDN